MHSSIAQRANPPRKLSSKMLISCLKVASVLAALLLFFSVASAQVTIPPKIKRIFKPNQLPPETKVPKDAMDKDIDLAAIGIKYSIVSVTDKSNAKIKIEGTIKNIGRLPFSTGEGLQVAVLYEEDPGGGVRVVASREFTNLAVNETLKVVYVRDWNKSSPKEGKNPPSYSVWVIFHPDLYTDRFPGNDDGEYANDHFRKSAAEINSMSFVTAAPPSKRVP